MTPYALDQRRLFSDEVIRENPDQILAQIFIMLRTLLQHESDKEAERMARHHAANEDIRHK